MHSPKPPKGWRKAPLSSLSDVQTGIAKGKRVNGSPISLPYLRVANVQDGYIDLSVIKEITVEQTDVERYSLRDGDVLFTEGGDFDKLGRGTVWQGQLAPCLHQNHVFAVRPKLSLLLPEFLAYQAASEYGRRYFQLSSKQSTNLASINSTQLKEFPVLFPSLPEQRKIAEILRTWDEAIGKLEALKAAKERYKRTLLQKLLTSEWRFPEFYGQSHRKVRLGEVGTVSSAGVNKKISPHETSVRLLNYLDVFRREFIFDCELDHCVTASSKKIAQCDVRHGDIFFTPSSETADEIAISAVAAEDMSGVVYSYHVVRFRLQENWDINFRAYVFQADDLRRQAHRLGDGSGQRYVISKKNFQNMMVNVPSRAEQERIGAVLKTASGEINALLREIDILTRQKRGLMQKLLTGEWRVTVERGCE